MLFVSEIGSHVAQTGLKFILESTMTFWTSGLPPYIFFSQNARTLKHVTPLSVDVVLWMKPNDLCALGKAPSAEPGTPSQSHLSGVQNALFLLYVNFML